ncbi:MAG: hypothetical protein QM831_42940 [Kofleriaceae bacterium]
MRWIFAVEATVPAPAPVPQTAFVETKLQHNSWHIAWLHGAFVGSMPLVCWGDRYAAMIRASRLQIFDAQRTQFAQLSLTALGVSMWHGQIAGTELWCPNYLGTLQIPLLDLETLFDQPAGPIAITIETHYTKRLETERVEGTVQRVDTYYTSVRVPGRHDISIRSPEPLTVGTAITLCDRLSAGTYGHAEVGATVVQLESPKPPYDAGAVLAHITPAEPSRPVSAATTPTRAAELRTLLLELAATDDDATRAIIIDILAEAELPCAAAFQKLRTGTAIDRNLRKNALGVLTQFVRDVEFRGGMPWSAYLNQQLPTSPELRTQFTDDVRLGMFARLRRGNSTPVDYAKILGTGAFIGLRRIDGNPLAIAEMIRLGQPITHLHDVQFDLLEPFLDRLDSVHWIEFRTGAPVIDKLLKALCDNKHLKRKNRHFSFVASNLARTRALEPEIRAAYPDLPCSVITLGDITIRTQHPT